MQAVFREIQPSEESSFSTVVEEQHQFFPLLHYHEEIELIWIKQSSGTCIIGNHIGEFREGDLYLIGSNLPHYFSNEFSSNNSPDYCKTIVLKFKEHFLGENFLKAPEMKEVKGLFQKAKSGIRVTQRTEEIVKRILPELTQLDGLDRLLALLNILRHLSCSHDLVFLSESSFRPDFSQYRFQNHVHSQKINLVLSYIMDNLTNEIRQGEVAKLVEMSPGAFSRFFKKITGKTFIGTVNQLRVEKACQKLIKTETEITRIALECGFENLSNFNRQFKSILKSSPGEYRKKHFGYHPNK